MRVLKPPLASLPLGLPGIDSDTALSPGSRGTPNGSRRPHTLRKPSVAFSLAEEAKSAQSGDFKRWGVSNLTSGGGQRPFWVLVTFSVHLWWQALDSKVREYKWDSMGTSS